MASFGDLEWHGHTADVVGDFVKSLGGGVGCAIAYGSGAIKQMGYNKGASVVVDLILGVTNGWAWHEENLIQNRDHYSLIPRLCGGNSIAKLQEGGGGRIYYNIGVKYRGVEIKYGTISIRRLIEDLLLWDNFYLAGRFHKPMIYVKGGRFLEQANHLNRLNAVRMSLLMLGSKFTENELLETIVGLSYIGDFRVAFAENPRKVKNIISAQGELLRKFVQPLMYECSVSRHSNDVFVQEVNAESRMRLISLLPEKFKAQLIQGADISSVASLSQEGLRTRVQESISKVTRVPIFMQTAKGFISAGPLASVSYALRKLGLFINAKRFR